VFQRSYGNTPSLFAAQFAVQEKEATGIIKHHNAAFNYQIDAVFMRYAK
jgi:hypothetical protein